MNEEHPSWKLPADAVDWECNWESSTRFQLNYWAGLTLQEMIEALEEMSEMTDRLSPVTRPDAATVCENPPQDQHT